MLEIIWGLKTTAIMDVWTIEHVLSGLSVGHAVVNNNHKVFKKKFGLERHHIITNHFDIIGVLFLAYFWETIEHYLEIGIAGGASNIGFKELNFGLIELFLTL